jgi:hypothetical protein
MNDTNGKEPEFLSSRDKVEAHLKAHPNDGLLVEDFVAADCGTVWTVRPALRQLAKKHIARAETSPRAQGERGGPRVKWFYISEEARKAHRAVSKRGKKRGRPAKAGQPAASSAAAASSPEAYTSLIIRTAVSNISGHVSTASSLEERMETLGKLYELRNIVNAEIARLLEPQY